MLLNAEAANKSIKRFTLNYIIVRKINFIKKYETITLSRLFYFATNCYSFVTLR